MDKLATFRVFAQIVPENKGQPLPTENPSIFSPDNSNTLFVGIGIVVIVLIFVGLVLRRRRHRSRR